MFGSTRPPLRLPWSSRRYCATALAGGALLLIEATSAAAGVGVWTTNGPYRGGIGQAGGTNVLSLAIDPVHPTTVYAGAGYFGAGGDGVFKSADGGATWNRVNIGLPGITVRALALDPHDPMILYAGGEGVFRSTDGAATWTSTFGPGANTLVIPQPTATLFAGNNAGVFQMPLAGTSWSGGSADALVVASLAADPSPISPPTLYATNDRGVFKSVDGGVSWTAMNAGLANPVVNAVAIDSARPTTLYAATGNFGAASGGVFKSLNGGASWTAANTGLTSSFVLCVAVDPVDPGTLYAGTYGAGVFKSVNGGATWTPLNAGLGNLIVQVLAIDPASPTTLYAGTQHGVYRLDQDLSTTATPTRTAVPNIDPRGMWVLSLGPRTCQATVVSLPPTLSFTVDCPATGELSVTLTLDARTGSFSGTATDPTCAQPVTLSGLFSVDGDTVNGTAICPSVGIAGTFSGTRIARPPTATRTETPLPPTATRTPTLTAIPPSPTLSVTATVASTASATGPPPLTQTPTISEATAAPTTTPTLTTTVTPTNTSPPRPVDRVLGLAAGSVEPGHTLTVTLILEGDGDQRAASADVEIMFDAGVLELHSPVAEYCTIDSRLAQTHELGGRLLADDRLLLSVYPLAAQVQPLGDGLLGTCALRVRSDAVSGPTMLALDELTVGDVDGHALAVRGTGATALIIADTPTPTAPPLPTASIAPALTASPTSTGTAKSEPVTPIASPATATVTAPTTGTAMPPSTCVGDCDGDHVVTVSELIEGVRMSLGQLGVDRCGVLDRDGNAQVTVDELIAAVQAALAGCE